MIVPLITVVVVLLIFFWSGIVTLVSALVSKPKPAELNFDAHETKHLEIENFGREWWEDFGTKCKCGKCNPPVPPRGPGEIAPKSRVGYTAGYNYSIPEEVPDQHSPMVLPNEYGSSDFVRVRLIWTDIRTGRQVFTVVMGTKDQFFHVFSESKFRRDMLEARSDYLRASDIETVKGYKA